MLRITPISSAEGAKRYFREALSKGEYYTQSHSLDQEITGYWKGLGAERLGLEGQVTGDAFERLCDNRHPLTGERLTPRYKDGRRVGYDVGFSVPKSVSLAYELGGDPRILSAFRDAVSATLAYMETEVQTRVRRGNADHNRTTGNLIAGEFVHFTSRPVDGVPDVHLHAHLVCFNATWDPVEDRWKAIDIADIKRDATYFEAVFHNGLAERLVELGYDIERIGTGAGAWEIAGVPESAIQKFSRRTEEVEKLAAELGIENPESKSKLGATSRAKKIAVASMSKLRALWVSRLSDHERRSIDALAERSIAGGRQIGNMDTEQAARAAFERASEHLFEQDSIVPQRRLISAALDAGVGRLTRQGLERFLNDQIAAGEVLRRDRDGRSWVTTPKVLAEERAMLTTVKEGRGQHDPLRVGYEIQDDALSSEQRDAVRHVLESTDMTILLAGRAGVGKTRTMREVVDAIEQTGRTVYVAAPTAMATHEVLRGDGFNAQTVASLLKDLKAAQKTKGQVIWVDEAGLLSVPDAKKLVQLAKDADARLLLTGDIRQHRSVIRGDAMRLLESECGLTVVELREIRRQQTPKYREAAKQLATGDLAKGIDTLERMGAVREIVDSEERNQAIGQSYFQSVNAGRSTLVVAPTHAEGRAVTEAIRAKLETEGLLRGESASVDLLQSRRLSQAEKGDAVAYREGDVVEFHQNAKGIKKGQRFEVLGRDDTGVHMRCQRDDTVKSLPLHQADRFDVYERRQLELKEGDRIRITAGGRTEDGKHRLHNGSIYEVDGMTKAGSIRLRNGWTIGRDFGHVTHGYAVTSDASQGRTVDHVILAQSGDSYGAGSRQQWYTSITRGRHQASIFTDDKDRLMRSVDRDASRISATELVRDDRGRTPPRERGLIHRTAIGRWLHRQVSERRDRQQQRLNDRDLTRTKLLHKQQRTQHTPTRTYGGRERER